VTFEKTGETEFFEIVTFTIYIQDKNGNPPVSGSELEVTKLGPPETIVLQKPYLDTYTDEGTWRDRADPSTNRPIKLRDVTVDSTFRFTFTPVCGTEVPGCSGLVQVETY